MSGVRKRKKLNSIQLFTFTHATHSTFCSYIASYSIYVRKNQLNSLLYARKIYATVEIHL